MHANGRRNGPNEFYITGTLKTWTVVDEVHKILAPTLLVNGKYDEAQDSVMEPFFKQIKDVKWERFEESSHLPQLEEPEKFLQVVGDFLGAE
jgi:pimeloyl-ACP methyl ester carboxylesterase